MENEKQEEEYRIAAKALVALKRVAINLTESAEAYSQCIEKIEEVEKLLYKKFGRFSQ